MKKYFSKIIALAVFTSLMLILSACGAGGSEGDKGESSEKKETLKVVTNAAYAPFEYIDKGKVVGFDIDFINAVAKEAGYKVDIKHTGWDQCLLKFKENKLTWQLPLCPLLKTESKHTIFLFRILNQLL